MRLDGRTALITGGTQGVGAVIAERLAEAGCNLVLHGLRADRTAEQTVRKCRELGRQFTCSRACPNRQARLCHCWPSWIDWLRVNIPINNAGGFCASSS